MNGTHLARKEIWKAHRKAQLEQLSALAAATGGKLLSKRYTSNKSKLRWRCEKGHGSVAIPTNVCRGHWCSICGNNRQGRSKAHTTEMMREVAARKGGECLSAVHRDNLTKLRWRCPHGHEWESVPGSMVEAGDHKGTWCPICAGRLSKEDAFSELAKLATKRGGQLLSTKYRDTHGKLHWQCAKRHEWTAIADAIKSVFEKSLAPRGSGLGVPRLRGPLAGRRPNRVNAELQTRVFKQAPTRPQPSRSESAGVNQRDIPISRRRRDPSRAGR